jgi:hypothetical protein
MLCYRNQTRGKVDRRYCLNNQASWHFAEGFFYFEKQDFPKSKNRDIGPLFLTSLGAKSYNLHRAGIARVVVAAYPHHIISTKVGITSKRYLLLMLTEENIFHR